MNPKSLNRLKLERIFKIIQGHEQRISSLEKATRSEVGIPATSEKDKRPRVEKYSGPTGGTRFLVSKGFFKKKRGLATVRKELAENNYHYSRQAIHEALKHLSKSGGPLVSLRENKKKVYVERK